MKFCSKCGKELMDEAVICPGCGCAVGSGPRPMAEQHSEFYLTVKRFSDQVKPVYTISIVSIVLCLGIGIIFAILSMVRSSKIVVPELSLTNPSEQAEFESAKKKLALAKKLASITFVVFVVLMTIIVVGACIGAILDY